MAFLGILMHLLKTNISPACQEAVFDVCAKSVPVWGKSGEMRGLLRAIDMPFSFSGTFKECLSHPNEA